MKKPRILLIHNFYKQSGGEDIVFKSEKKLLSGKGHELCEWTDDNSRVQANLAFAANAIWSAQSYRKALEIASQLQPDIAHIHNTWMIFSPSIYYAFQKLKIPVVQTLHNYRLLCPNALFLRENVICETCLNKPFAYPGVIYKCYRGSRSETLMMSIMLFFHRLLHTWQKKVDAYIVLSEFARQKFVQGGLPSEKLFVKPNFVVSEKKSNKVKKNPAEYTIFVGRLSEEKGIKNLLHAWESLHFIPIKIVGDGPLRSFVQKFAAIFAHVDYLGKVEHTISLQLMASARFLVFSSICYEGFPMTIIEAFSCGIPVIAPRLGGIPEIVDDYKTGLLCRPGDSSDLVSKVNWLWNHPEESIRMGENARRDYEARFTPEKNYELLMDIYEQSMKKQNRPFRF